MRQSTTSLRLAVAAALATIAVTISLGSTFLRGSWFLPSVFAVVFVTVGCELARRSGLSRPWVPLGGAAALFAYLVLSYAGEEAMFGILPTPASLDRLQEIAAAGRTDIERYAAPIGVSPGVELLTVAGVGLVALAVDTLAVTWHRAAVAGLPLLVLFTVPTALAPDGVGWVAFTIGAIGFLALLLAEARERVSRWGRAVTSVKARRGFTPEVQTSPLNQVGRRVGATALGLALVVPAVLPNVGSLGGIGWGSGGFGGGGGGDGKVAVINPILSLGKDLRRPENRPILRYRGEPTYIRVVGLDEFTGDRWAPSELEVSREDNDVEDGLTRAPGLSSSVETKKRRYTFEIFSLRQTWLPLPYPATKVGNIEGSWLYDSDTFNVFGENTSTFGLSYDVQALDVRPTVDQLREAPATVAARMKRYVRVPQELRSELRGITDEVVGDAPTQYDRALAIQEWLRSDEFLYSPDVSSTVGDGSGTDAILAFLEYRQGYCVQFASAMATMARTLDIPARVAVGFIPGVREKQGSNSWIVSLHDLHSWPELYFAGVGWVRFEPTPAARGVEPPEWAQPDVAGPPEGPDAAGSPDAVPSPRNGTDSPRNAEGLGGLDPALTNEGTDGDGGLIGAGPVQVSLVPLLIGLGLLLLLAAPSAARFLVRRRRWSRAAAPAAQARAAWADLLDTMTDLGRPWREADSPRAGIDRLVEDQRLEGPAAEAARRLATATERARYAPTMAEVGDLRADADTVRAAMLERAGRAARWRARLLPRSARVVVHAFGEKTADLLDAIDAGLAAVTGRFTGKTRRA